MADFAGMRVYTSAAVPRNTAVITNITDGYRLVSRHLDYGQVLKKAMEGHMKKHALDFVEQDGRMMLWETRRDAYRVTVAPKWLAREHGIHLRAQTTILGEALARATTNAEAARMIALEVGSLVEGFWGDVSAEVTSARFPGHDGPAPDSPAGIYQAAFG